jgi:two-component system response regulator YesN
VLLVLTLLIADGDKRVRDTIKNIVKSSPFSITVASEADSEEKAIRHIIEYQPDIVIVSVGERPVDGFRLAEKVRKYNVRSEFVAVSESTRFDDVQKALHRGMKGYLTKPIGVKQLKDLLGSLQKHIMRRRLRQRHIAKVENQLCYCKHKMRELFMRAVISGRYSAKDWDIEKINRENMMNFRQGKYVAVEIKVDIKKKAGPPQNIVDRVCRIAREKIAGVCFEIEYVKKLFAGVFILNYGSAVKIDNVLQELMEGLREEYAGKCGITIGVSTEKETMDAIMFDQAGRMAFRRMVLGDGNVIRSNGANLAAPGFCKPEMCEKLAAHVKTANERKLTEFFSAIEQNVRSAECEPYAVYQGLLEYYTIVADCLKTHGQRGHGKMISKEKYRQALYNCTLVNEMLCCAFSMLKKEIKKYYDWCFSQDIYYIRKAKNYIGEHFSGVIKLDDVANLVHLTPVYFSSLFKKETGVNFRDYLITYRIEKAKEMLIRDDGPSVRHIANEVGYKDAKSFAKLFKKTVGIQPSLYRKFNVMQ